MERFGDWGISQGGGGGGGGNKSGRLFSVLTRQGRGMRLHAPSRWILLLGGSSSMRQWWRFGE